MRLGWLVIVVVLNSCGGAAFGDESQEGGAAAATGWHGDGRAGGDFVDAGGDAGPWNEEDAASSTDAVSDSIETTDSEASAEAAGDGAADDATGSTPDAMNQTDGGAVDAEACSELGTRCFQDAGQICDRGQWVPISCTTRDGKQRCDNVIIQCGVRTECVDCPTGWSCGGGTEQNVCGRWTDACSTDIALAENPNYFCTSTSYGIFYCPNSLAGVPHPGCFGAVYSPHCPRGGLVCQ
ncbi:MAG TPA: hypothetical protein VFT22_18890 [Kofleriaceae bacterium]|nr:hypothetical protein [Kofleriaceae bacterium]